MSNWVLVKECSNYGDEFDMYGFSIWETSKFEEYKNKVKEACDKHFGPEEKGQQWDNPIAICFGTNEDMTYYSTEEVMEIFEEVPISEEEYQVLNKFFRKSYGTTFFPGFLRNLE